MGGIAAEVEALRASELALAPPVQVPLNKAIVVEVPLLRRASGFVAENWQWLWVLVALPLAGAAWAWRAQHSAYDKAGLPRGPKF